MLALLAQQGARLQRRGLLGQLCQLLASRGYTGFSMPSPKNLDEVMKLDLLLPKSPDEVANLWVAGHADESRQRVAGLLTAGEYAKLAENAKRCPMFVLPLLKPKGAYLTLVLQVQQPYVMFSTLDEYRRLGPSAPPHLTLTYYTELAASKQLVLVRGDIISPALINAAEARTMMELTRAFYSGSSRDFEMVRTFNQRPGEFDFDALLKKLGHGATSSASTPQPQQPAGGSTSPEGGGP